MPELQLVRYAENRCSSASYSEAPVKGSNSGAAPPIRNAPASSTYNPLFPALSPRFPPTLSPLSFCHFLRTYPRLFSSPFPPALSQLSFCPFLTFPSGPFPAHPSLLYNIDFSPRCYIILLSFCLFVLFSLCHFSIFNDYIFPVE